MMHIKSKSFSLMIDTSGAVHSVWKDDNVFSVLSVIGFSRVCGFRTVLYGAVFVIFIYSGNIFLCCFANLMVTAPSMYLYWNLDSISL